MNSEATNKLGRAPASDDQRDAVHIAIVPVIAGEKLFPGQDVGIEEGRAVRCRNPIGIIDPFLKRSVQRNEPCWLLIYPGTITSLRHDWTHPALDSGTKGIEDDGD
jgi:hypothetical protein